MIGLDGSHIQGIVTSQLKWWDFGLSLQRDLIRGDGPLSFPLNAWLILPYALQGLVGDVVHTQSVYIIVSIEVFLATYIAGRLLGFESLAAICGSWVVTLSALPFFSPFGFYPITVLIPHIAEQLAVSTLVCAILFRLSTFSRVGMGLAAITLLVFLLQMVLSNPVGIVLFAPMIAAFGFAGFAPAFRDKPSLTSYVIVCILVAGLVLLVAGAPAVGWAAFSAPRFFPEEFGEITITANGISSFFSGDASSIVIMAGGILGAFLIVATRAGRQRIVALSYLLIVLAHLIFGIIVLNLDIWIGPYPIYFEVAIWPFSALYLAYLTIRLLDLIFRFEAAPGVLISAAVVGICGFNIYFVNTTQGYDNLWRPPYSENSLNAKLVSDLAFEPGMPFRGRMANFIGMSRPGKTDWYAIHTIDGQLLADMKSELRYIGPGFQGIPVLQEYSQTVTALNHFVKSRLFARPADKHVRNITLFTRPDTRLLRLFGVKYVISEEAIEGSRRRNCATTKVQGFEKICLYELPDPNLANYSPTELIKVDDLTIAVERMLGRFDPKKQAIVFDDLSNNLVPAQDTSLVSGANGTLQFSGKSNGTSMVILPFEFSKCQQIVPHKGQARLVQVNISQTGIVFSGEFSGTLTFTTGPFDKPFCRFSDTQAFERLDPAAAAKAFPVDVSSTTK